MRVRSLALRLFLAAAAWSGVLLVAGVFILTNLYRDPVEKNFEKSLWLYLENLVAKVEWTDDGVVKSVDPLADPRFDSILSGWYWQIGEVDPGADIAFSSQSLSMDTLPAVPGANGDLNEGVAPIEGPRGENLLSVWRLVELGDTGKLYLFMVAGNAGEIEAETAAFQRTVIWALAILGLALMITTFFQVRYGLQPLRRIGEQISAVRAGQTSRLEGNFPTEVEPLAGELNELISSNTAIIERARTHVGNLAHSLKTPLSVISNEARQLKNKSGKKIAEQSELMRDQITHHLDRARVAGQANVIGAVTDVYPVVDGIRRTMDRIHADKALAIDTKCAENLRFGGEQQDLEEMIGNLVDNACKWAKSRVVLAVEQVQSHDDPDKLQLHVSVSDDGPGMSASERAEMLRRGARSDETKPGSGLGLSIVSELAELYDGEFLLANASIGGLRAQLTLPAV